jgi:hypothetical protein
MKTLICVLISLTSFVTKGFTQLNNPSTLVPSNGYWVVEKDAQSVSCASVYYYDNSDQVIFTELVRVQKNNFLTTKLKRKLNRRLLHLLQEEAKRGKSESETSNT